MRLMSASLLVLPLSASLSVLMGCLKVGAVILIVDELVAVVAVFIAGVPPRRLHGDASPPTSSDATDARLAACATVVCVAHSADGLP